MPEEEKVDGSPDNGPIDNGADPSSDLSSNGDQGAGKGWEDAVAKQDKRINDLRSQYDKRLDEAAAREAKLLAMLESGVSAKDNAANQQRVEEAKADLIKKYDEGELTGEQFYRLLEGIAEDARESALSDISEKLTAEQQERKALQEKLAALESNTDPAYVANREKVDAAMQKYGVTREQAMKIVADQKPSQPARPDTAGGLGGTGVTGRDGGSIDERISNVVAGLAAHVTGKKPTEAQMKKHGEKWSKK